MKPFGILAAVLLALASEPVPAASVADEGVEVRYVISRIQSTGAGGSQQQRTEEAWRLRFGETLTAQGRGPYAMKLAVTDKASAAHVEVLSLIDHAHGDFNAGMGAVDVPFEGSAEIRFPQTDDVLYSVILFAKRRPLPAP